MRKDTGDGPGTDAHTYSPAPTCGNLGGFSKEIETLTLQTLTYCHKVRELI